MSHHFILISHGSTLQLVIQQIVIFSVYYAYSSADNEVLQQLDTSELYGSNFWHNRENPQLSNQQCNYQSETT